MKDRNAISPALLKIHDVIRKGELTLASLELAAWVKAERRLLRCDLAPLAGLYRRLRKPEAALRLLNPVVRPSTALSSPATNEERAEYAGSLIRLGAVQEAIELLNQLSAATCPNVDLFYAFACIHQWDYAGAVSSLEDFLANDLALNDYDRKIARVNLAASLVSVGRAAPARALILDLKKETELSGDHLLHANLCEIAAQNEFAAGDFSAVAGWLREAEHLIDPEESLDGFFVAKWKGLLALHTPGGETNLTEIKSLRVKALHRRHWESVRDLDFHVALATKDKDLLRFLHAGTPFAALRRRYAGALSKFSKREAEAPSGTVVRELGSGPRVVTLHVETGENSASDIFLKTNQLPQRTLSALNRDFYRPQRLGELHQVIYPGMFFSPLSSAQRIYQALRRLKVFFQESKIPLNIGERNGFYALEAEAGFRVRLVDELRVAEATTVRRFEVEVLLKQFRSQWRNPTFNSQDFCQKMQIPKRTSLRYLSQAVACRLVQKQGGGARTNYQFN